MIRIGLMSDTHGVLPDQLFEYFQKVDEIWHAGDIGSVSVADSLESFKPFRAVYGNVDGNELRARYPLDLRFRVEDLAVWMTHIGGYPGKYAPSVAPRIRAQPPGLFISGHSHILKIIPDPALGLLHINPGACGNEGWHRARTLVRFSVEAGRVLNPEVIELPRNGPIQSR